MKFKEPRPPRVNRSEPIEPTEDPVEFDPRELITEADHTRYLEIILHKRAYLRLQRSFLYAMLFPNRVHELQLEDLWEIISPTIDDLRAEGRGWCRALFPGRCEPPPPPFTPPTERSIDDYDQQGHHIPAPTEVNIRRRAGALAAYHYPPEQAKELWTLALIYLEHARSRRRDPAYVESFAWLRLIDPERMKEWKPSRSQFALAKREYVGFLELERGGSEPETIESLTGAFSLLVATADLIPSPNGGFAQVKPKEKILNVTPPLPPRNLV